MMNFNKRCISNINSIDDKGQDTMKKQIIDLLLVDSQMTGEDLAIASGVSSNAVEPHIANIRSEGKLLCLSSRRTGEWRVVND